jgi:periodic tryptophan protein 2
LNDSKGGRSINDIRSAKKRSFGKVFTSVSYSPNGKSVIASGNSLFVCIYNVDQKILIKKFQISSNLSLDGVLDKLSTTNIKEGGNVSLIDHDHKQEKKRILGRNDLKSKKEKKLNNYIPGVLTGFHSSSFLRSNKIVPRSFSVSFSSTGRSWCCASTEGILLYSMDDSLFFDPYQLDYSVTPQNILLVLSEKNFLDALIVKLIFFSLFSPFFFLFIYLFFFFKDVSQIKCS